MTKAAMKKFSAQAAGILATAGVAAALAFIQSIASANGITCTPSASPELAGGVGVFLRSAILVLPSITGVKLS